MPLKNVKNICKIVQLLVEVLSRSQNMEEERSKDI